MDIIEIWRNKKLKGKKFLVAGDRGLKSLLLLIEYIARTGSTLENVRAQVSAGLLRISIPS
jgi:hypothetical protein